MNFRAYFLGVLIGGVALVAAGAPRLTGGHAPKLVCDQPVFNFGTRDSSGEVDHTFIIRNVGDLSLQIFSVRPTCGCTTAALVHRMVPPGGETAITARFNLGGRQGPQEKIVYVASDDPAQPDYPLTLKGTIVEAVEVQPGLLFFGRLDAAAMATGMVQVVASDTNTLRITRLDVDSPLLVASVAPPVSDRVQQVRVTTKPPLPEGLTRARLRITTTHPRKPQVEVVVSFFVPGVFSVLPPEIFVVGRPGEKMARTISIRSEKNEPFKILAVEPPRPDIRCQTVAERNTAYRIELQNVPVDRELEGRPLRVSTDRSDRPELLIPFRVFFTQ